MLLVREQNPDLDIRLVFSNCNQKIYKGSPLHTRCGVKNTTFVYANKRIPAEWIAEGDLNGEEPEQQNP